MVILLHIKKSPTETLSIGSAIILHCFIHYVGVPNTNQQAANYPLIDDRNHAGGERMDRGNHRYVTSHIQEIDASESLFYRMFALYIYDFNIGETCSSNGNASSAQVGRKRDLEIRRLFRCDRRAIGGSPLPFDLSFPPRVLELRMKPSVLLVSRYLGLLPNKRPAIALLNYCWKCCEFIYSLVYYANYALNFVTFVM